MNRMLKKILALVMTITLLVGVIPAEALAAVNSVTSKTVSPFAASIQAVKPEEKVATYTFLVGGVVQEEWTQSKTAGETVELPGAPEGNGEFLGWYRDNEKVTSLVVTEADLGKTIELTAKFSEFRYVEFMSRDGNVVVYTAKADGDADVVSSEVLETAASLVPGLDGEESVAGWSRKLEGDAETVTFGDGTVRYYPVIERGYWVTFDSDGGTYFAPQFAKPNTTVTLPDANQVSKPGYTFAGWELNGNKVTEVDSTAVVKATWTPNADTKYTVIHWYENADDNGYTFHKSETKTGTTGALTQAQALTEKTSGKNIRGEDVSDNVFQAKDFEQETISGDGSTIVNIYYTRKLYTITFDGSSSRVLICGKQEHTHNWWCRRHDCTKEEHSHNSSCYKTEVSAYASITKKYGATISQSEWPKDRSGNANWSLGNSKYIAFQSTMPMGDSSLRSTDDTGKENTATYYVEAISSNQAGAFNKNGRWFVVHHQDVTIGTSGYTVGVEDRYAIDGFTPIPEMGTQVGKKYANAEFYYSRNSYNVVYMNNGTKANERGYKFEADISDAGNYTPERPSGVNPDYVFYGWYKDPDGTQEMDFTGMTMPAGDLVVYAKWAPKKANAQVHLKVSLSGTPVSFEVEYGKKLKDISNAEYASYEELVAAVRNANLDANGKPVSGNLVWYRVDENGNKISRFNENTEIRGDIILAPFFPDDTLSYTVTYTGAGSTEDSSRYQSGSTAYLLKPAGTASLTFQGWKVTQGPDDIFGKVLEPGTGVKMTEDVVLEAQYTKAPDKLTLTYHSKLSGAAEGNHNLNAEIKDIRANTTVTVQSLEELEFMEEDQIPGYQFKGWATEEGGEAEFQPGDKVTITADGSNDLWAVWQRKVKTQKLYVYTKVTGDTTGLVLNKDGWYTLGYVELDLPDPDGYDFGTHEHNPYLAAAIAAAKGSSMNRYEKNTSIAMDKVEFPDDSENEYGLRVAKGATSYEDDGLAKTWHLNGKIDVKYLGTVVYHYINTADGAEMEASSGDVYTVGTALTFSKDSAKGFNNMHCVGVSLTSDKASASESVSYTVEHKNQDVYYFYAPDEAAYTVRFMEKDTENSLLADGNGTAAYGTIFTPDELKQEIPGFRYDSADKEELTIGANSTDNVITLYYVKNSYKVTYKVDGEVVGEEETYNYNDLVTIREKYEKEGYTVSDWSISKDFNMPAHDVDITATTVARTDITYTVKYLWTDGEGSGTAIEGVGDKVVENQTFNGVVKESPIEIPGYTAINSGEVEVPLDSLNKVITFLYYKNVTLVANGDTVDYDGTEHSVSGFTGAPEDADFSSVQVGTTGTNVGSYDAKFAETTKGETDGTGRYYIVETQDATLVINPVEIHIVTDGDSKVYDGQPLTAGGHVEGLVNGETATVTTTGSQTEVGSSSNTYGDIAWGNTDSNNYVHNTDKDELGTLTVTPKSIDEIPNVEKQDVEVNTPEDHLYDGEIHQWVPTVSDQRETQRVLVQDRDYTVSYDTENFVDVKTVTVTIRGIGNYTGQVVRTYKITPRPVTVIAASNTWEYDGNDHTESGWLVAPSDAVSGLVKTDAIADVTVTGSQRIVGSSANVASNAVFAEGTLAGNYTVSYQDGTLEVTGRAVRYNLDVQPSGGNFLYDGTEHTVSGYTFQAEGATFASKLRTFFAVRSGGEGDSFTLGGNTFTLSGIAVAESRTNAGQTIVHVTGTPVVTDDRGNDVTDQFSVTLKTAELNVARRDVLLGSVSDAKRFDNTPLTNNGTYVGGENGFAPGEGATFQVTGSQTAVGFSTNWFTYTLNDNTLAENYDIRLAYGTLTVTQVPVYTLTVHYVDENGAQLAPDYVGGFEAGAQYLVYSPAVEGYKPEFDFVRSAAQGMPAANVELTVSYTQDDQPTPDAETEPTVPGGEIEPTEDGGYDITPITEDDVPLAGGGEHKDDIVHFLLMAAALVVQILFADKRKKTQKEIFELKQKLGDTSMDDDN